ncbi:MAG TPA: hypothetical protein VFQ16_02525 [Burkholderiaceae bacterium]|nr:hypothetical protein [Burkholderiaceae bacterium]
MIESDEPPPSERSGLMLVAEVQDHLLVASHDLDRLQTLLADACSALAESFLGASDHAGRLCDCGPGEAAAELNRHLGRAVTALQFQDMASQLITHTHRRLRNCADRLAADAFGADDDDGAAVVEDAPMRPNPVTQDEMDAGSIELF